MNVAWIWIRLPHQVGAPNGSIISPSRTLDAPLAPWLERTWRSRLRRWLVQYPFGRLPSDIYPRDWSGLRNALTEARPSVVAFYLPYLAYFADHAPIGVPVVGVLEEGWERHLAERLVSSSSHRSRWAWACVARREATRYARVYRRVNRRASAVVAISVAEKEWLSRNIDADKIAVVPHGIDLSYFAPLDSEQLDTDVLVVGDLSAARNYEGALRTWELARSAPESVSWRWSFVGPIDPGAASTLVGGAARVTGVVDDVRPYYRRTRAVLVPALSGTGVKTTSIQAWATRRPLVASRIGARGLPVQPEENVLIGDNPQQLVHQLHRALADQSLADRLATNGRLTAEQHCDLSVLAHRFVDLCRFAAGDRTVATQDDIGNRMRGG